MPMLSCYITGIS